MKTIHIVASSYGATVLRAALRRAKRDEKVIGHPDQLGWGPIDPPDPAARVKWLVEALGFRREDWAWLPRKVRTFWTRALQPEVRRVIWTSTRSVEHINFLDVISRLGDEPCEVIDVADIPVQHSARDGRHWRGPALTLGMLDSGTIVTEALWDQARPLERAQRIALRQTWSDLQRENAPLRVVGPGGLASAPLSAFDEQLVSHASQEWRPAFLLIGHVLADGDGEYFQVGDHPLAARLAELIQAGRLQYRQVVGTEAEGVGYRFGRTTLSKGAEVRLPGLA